MCGAHLVPVLTVTSSGRPADGMEPAMIPVAQKANEGRQDRAVIGSRPDDPCRLSRARGPVPHHHKGVAAMVKLVAAARKFAAGEEGATLVEYSLLVALLAAASIAIL